MANPEQSVPDQEEPAPPPYLVPHSREPYKVVYADADLLLVRKPDLLLTVPGRHPANHDCLLTRLQQEYPEALLVHRLDLDTSGILIFARHREAQASLARQFQNRQIGKGYTALVTGRVSENSGTIDLPIARDWERRPLQKICADTGRRARTHFRVLKHLENCTRLWLEPVTGRSHQLRIHCRELGHPILGCDMYAPDEVLGRAPRLMLHATRVSLYHPRHGGELVGHSPAPF